MHTRRMEFFNASLSMPADPATCVLLNAEQSSACTPRVRPSEQLARICQESSRDNLVNVEERRAWWR